VKLERCLGDMVDMVGVVRAQLLGREGMDDNEVRVDNNEIGKTQVMTSEVGVVSAR
jgi:hypothetical protein